MGVSTVTGYRLMSPEEQQELNTCVQRIAQLLHQDAQAQQLPMGDLAQIEQTVRHQLQTHVAPELGLFLSTRLAHPKLANIDAPLKVF